MARSGRETARKIKSRQATLYSSSGDEASGETEKRKEEENGQQTGLIFYGGPTSQNHCEDHIWKHFLKH